MTIPAAPLRLEGIPTMAIGFPAPLSPRLRLWCVLNFVLFLVFILSGEANGQTPSTGALVGVAFDPSGSVVPGLVLSAINLETGRLQTTISDKDGRFSFLLLQPGIYEVKTSKAGFAALSTGEIDISVTETHHIEIHLALAGIHEQVEVTSERPMVQTDNVALGRVVNENALSHLPLVTRNLAQISGLSPGVTAGVFNASELGLGGMALSQIAGSNDGIFVHGARSYENNWELDGISVSDVQSSGAGSGGIPVPNPDSLQEFKVQTALYDATYGRYAGANVSVVTKPGTGVYNGTVFEFLRNDFLNANDFFLNRAALSRPNLKQNQFGFTLGGPVMKEKLLFFSSYQGTTQINGVAAGQARVACTATLTSPPLTDDRSQAALGKLFAGMSGELGGVAVRPDGSNINASALAILNLRLQDGKFLIPSPHTVDQSLPFASQGSSIFTAPCKFNEDQFLVNADYLPLTKTSIAARTFFANDNTTITFPGNFFNSAPNVPGFTSFNRTAYRVVNVAHTHTFSGASLNELRFGYVRTTSRAESQTPLKWSDVGVMEGGLSQANELPNLNIVGSIAFSSAFPFGFAQNSFVLSDGFSFVKGPHGLRVGGSLTRLQDNFNDPGIGSFVQFLSWPDFLLGRSSSGNGSAFSNVFASIDDFGLFDREYRVWEGSAFVQDDFRIRPSLTLNAGIRYERLGQFGDRLGRNSSFDISKANPNPGPEGSVAGYLVASNFPDVSPPGVVRTNNTFANNGEGQNTLAPRVGFAWNVLPKASTLVLRGGYGLYFSRSTGQAFFQGASASPFALLRVAVGATNSGATFEAPFAQPFPTPKSFPLFASYSPLSATTIYTSPPEFGPAQTHQYSLNIQGEPLRGWLLEAAYVGTRGTHSQRVRSLNQAMHATPEKPIRGMTADSLANIPLRVPVTGIPADSLDMVESAGSSWYNALELNLTKRMGHGVELLASYTFSKALDTDGANINGTSAGIALTLGDQNSPKQRWGRASFDRTHRIIVSETWDLPGPKTGLGSATLGGWNLAAVVTIQSGPAITIADTNANNVFGISEDRAELVSTCTKGQFVNGGPIESKLNAYFNTSCFTSPPIIGVDGIGTGFGNSATGLVDGPPQANIDLAVSKVFLSNWPHEKCSIQFRAEFFNALNHPQFSNPDVNFTSPTFGVITSTSVNPRVGQVAMRLTF